DLTADQQAFVLERFFDTNPAIVNRFPRYAALRALRDDGAAFAEGDLRDLQVLFNLAWTDPSFLEEEPLAALVAKGEGFSEDDKAILFGEHLRIVGEVTETVRRVWDAGQIEVTTTPLAHPILPLIYDSAIATQGDPTAIMPIQRFREGRDAQDQVERGLDVAERLLGRRPVGMWPGEGAVSQLTIPIFSGKGVQWIATGEDVLAPSLGIGEFDRNETDTVVEADLLYRPWKGVPSRQPELPIVFRDRVLSDLVGFQYSGTQADLAAQDFVNRLRDIKDRLDEQGATGPHIVSVILDGENAWENYPNDGIDFLRALYGQLAGADFVTTITPSEYLAAFGDTVEPLDEVWPGAWFSPNYATWIGEDEEAAAWDYLWQVRDDLKDAEASVGDGVTEEQYAAAYEKMLFAEGSDWLWWYGDDQSSGNDDYFDTAFRELLGQVYDAVGFDRPAFVGIPIIPETPVAPDVGAGENLLSVTIDGSFPDGEWDDAAAYRTRFEAADLDMTISFGITPDGLHMRVDSDGVLDGDVGFDLYLSTASGSTARAKTLGDHLLGFGATDLYRWSAADPEALWVAEAMPGLESDEASFSTSYPVGAAAQEDHAALEFTIPIADLGPIEAGDLIVFRLVPWVAGIEATLMPTDGPGAAQVPDISNVDVFLDVADPLGDDHGPGAYTYPLDAVFPAGSYDLANLQIGTEGDDLVFTFEVVAPIVNSWGSPNGLSVQTFDVYIDQDPGAGTGARTLIDGRNAALKSGNGWEYGVTIEGWMPAVYTADAGGETLETTPTIRIITLGDKRKVIARIPLAVFGGGDPSTWGYAVALMSQEGYPSSGVRRIRDVMPNAEQWRLGGGPAAGISHTRIMDVAWPEEGVQEAMLGTWTIAESIAELRPDDFGLVPLLTAGG
ncbi:MAG: glucodextranase DOMON-like domain-containing protein, partial [Actinomycetota bacterium]